MPIRRLSRPWTLAAIALGAALAPLAGAANELPKIIKFMVPAQPGGGLDAVARALSDSLQQQNKGLTVLVENRPGAGSTLAAKAVLEAPSDGTHYLMATEHLFIVPFTLKGVTFDPLIDFKPVASINSFDTCYVVNASMTQAKTLPEFMQEVKNKPALNGFGISAVGSISQFYGYEIAKTSGVHLEPIAYKGAAPMMVDLNGGHLPSAMVPCRDAMEGVKLGRTRIIASKDRLDFDPSVPTFLESGFDIKGLNFIALFAPANAPAAINEKFEQAVKAVMQDSNFAQKIKSAGFNLGYKSGAELGDESKDFSVTWSKRIKESGFNFN